MRWRSTQPAQLIAPEALLNNFATYVISFIRWVESGQSGADFGIT